MVYFIGKGHVFIFSPAENLCSPLLYIVHSPLVTQFKTAILEQTAKSSPVNLIFCLFEKYNHVLNSLIEHYARISSLFLMF